MSPSEMVNCLEVYFRHPLPIQQSEMLVKKLGCFTDDQLDALYDKAIEDCKYLFARGANPVAQIYDVARNLGFLSTRPRESSQSHDWTPTDCKLCRGQGLIAIFFERLTDEQKALHRRITRIFPYSSIETMDYEATHTGEYSSLARCSCDAGDVPTLPGAWPKWSGRQQERRAEVQADRRERQQPREDLFDDGAWPRLGEQARESAPRASGMQKATAQLPRTRAGSTSESARGGRHERDRLA